MTKEDKVRWMMIGQVIYMRFLRTECDKRQGNVIAFEPGDIRRIDLMLKELRYTPEKESELAPYYDLMVAHIKEIVDIRMELNERCEGIRNNYALDEVIKEANKLVGNE